MPLAPYATEADLTTWLGENGQALPTGASATAYLRHAQRVIRSATVADVYSVDTAGNATDPDVIAALRDATTAQVGAWVALGVDPVAGPAGTTGVVQSSSLLGGSVQYATYASQAEERANATVAISADALGILQAAGLGSSLVAVTG